MWSMFTPRLAMAETKAGGVILWIGFRPQWQLPVGSIDADEGPLACR
jgi:hypothetical protein